jgi:hypothetical protein
MTPYVSGAIMTDLAQNLPKAMLVGTNYFSTVANDAYLVARTTGVKMGMTVQTSVVVSRLGFLLQKRIS